MSGQPQFLVILCPNIKAQDQIYLELRLLSKSLHLGNLRILYKSKNQIFHNFMKKLLFKLSMIHFIEELLEILYQALEEHLHQANLSSHN